MRPEFEHLVNQYVTELNKEKEGYTAKELKGAELENYKQERLTTKTTNHITVGIYPNGDYKYNVVADADLANHIEYNEKLRPGRMLFVDDKYTCGIKCEIVHPIKDWEEFVTTLNIDITKITKPYR